MFFKTSVLKEYKANEYITIKLIKKDKIYKSQIFINGEQFDQCKFLFLNNPKNRLDEINEFQSIDEIANKLETYKYDQMEINYNIPVSPEQAFWVHCT